MPSQVYSIVFECSTPSNDNKIVFDCYLSKSGELLSEFSFYAMELQDLRSVFVIESCTEICSPTDTTLWLFCGCMKKCCIIGVFRIVQ